MSTHLTIKNENHSNPGNTINALLSGDSSWGMICFVVRNNGTAGVKN